MPLPRCPHRDVQHCPLYHAAHYGGGLGCDDGKIDHAGGVCAVYRGANYRQLVELIRVQLPGVVERCEWNEALVERAGQRARNLTLNGIH